MKNLRLVLVLMSLVLFALNTYASAQSKLASADVPQLNALVPNGVQPNGTSLNGVQPNGTSLNGVTMNALVPNGLVSRLRSQRTLDFAKLAHHPLGQQARKKVVSFAPSTALVRNGLNPLLATAQPSPPGTATLPSELVDGEVKREQLRYLISCALAEGTSLESTADGVSYTFEGKLGLAPQWLERPLTLQEQRWVSACMLARTNYYGISILISLRAAAAPTTALSAQAEEREQFTLWEGGFYGNLFSDTPSAYVCVGAQTKLEAQDPILEKRICSQAVRSSEGRKLSACGFIVTGPCMDPGTFIVGEERYDEVIFTYLQPEAAVTRP